MLFHTTIFLKIIFYESMKNMDHWHALIITFQRIYWNVASFSLTVMRRRFQNQKYSIRLQKGIKKLCEQIFWTQNQKLRSILFYNFVSNINHMFRSDVTVLTLFSSEIVWSDVSLPMAAKFLMSIFFEKYYLKLSIIFPDRWEHFRAME